MRHCANVLIYAWKSPYIKTFRKCLQKPTQMPLKALGEKIWENHPLMHLEMPLKSIKNALKSLGKMRTCKIYPLIYFGEKSVEAKFLTFQKSLTLLRLFSPTVFSLLSLSSLFLLLHHQRRCRLATVMEPSRSPKLQSLLPLLILQPF